MSELDDRVSAWETRLTRAESVTADELVELRSHLRESIQNLVRIGLSEEEATLIALRRMGDPTALALEYSRVVPGVAITKRLYWAALGLVGFSIALGAVRLISHAGTWLMRGSGAADEWALVSGLVGLSLVFLSVVQTTRAPHGLIARLFDRAIAHAQERPGATAQTAFAALAGLTIVDHFATGFVWSLAWPDVFFAMSLLEAVLTTAVPICLFLLTTYLNAKRPMTAEPITG